MKQYAGFDLSFAFTGVAVIQVEKRTPKVVVAHLIQSDKSKTSTERIDDTVTEVKYILSKTNAEVICKEASIIRQVSTATPVIKTHAVFEHELADKYRIEDVSNSTVKAWARVVTGSDGKRKDKQMVADAVEKYYGESVREVMYTPRGRLLDDVADAIALMTLWLEKEGVIETKFKREKAVKK